MRKNLMHGRVMATISKFIPQIFETYINVIYDQSDLDRDIMSTVGGYLEYRGGCSVPWGDIMMHVGGYHEYRGGCSVPWGDTII